MRRSVPVALLACLVSLALAGARLGFPALVDLGLASPAFARQQWSPTRPAINETHVFEGEINRRGKPVGFHSRPNGRDPRDARVARVVDGPNRAGVYVAEVEIRDPDSGRWLGKRSSLFPDAMTRREVIDAILHAWENRTTGGSERFRGPSGRGFTIEGYLLGDGSQRINTAWPVFREDGR